MLKVMNPNITSEIPSTTYQNKGNPKFGASSHITSLPVDLSILISKKVYLFPGLEKCTFKILMETKYDFSYNCCITVIRTASKFIL
jgi:hypothetical protein